ncbi:MAG: M20 family metallopeptidase [Bacillota bacterium]
MMHETTIIDRIIKQETGALTGLAGALHRNPELGGREHYAAAILSDYLESKGFAVTRGAAGLETAFIARSGRGEGGFHVAFCAEYDALPEIGHGCGHNLIGTAAVAAGVALAGSLAELAITGTVSVIGTPNEEIEGGKVDLIRAGIFDGVDTAMMFHPGCGNKIDVTSLACRDFHFIFHGRNAHAACDPWEGRNALDGVIMTFTGINALRQHLKDDVRVHGIITEGGLAGNIIPDRAVAQICVRSKDNRYLAEVVERVKNCARGAALASGTELEILESPYPYDAMVSNRLLGEVFRESLAESGPIIDSPHNEGMGSIDMGNVSRVVPAIHPVLAVTDRLVSGHTAEFAGICGSEPAYAVALAAGQAMALTGLKVIRDPALQERIKAEFKAAAGS